MSQREVSRTFALYMREKAAQSALTDLLADKLMDVPMSMLSVAMYDYGIDMDISDIFAEGGVQA